MPSAFDRRTILLIVVAALGYFVDIYDLVLFNVVKRESLEFILGVGNARIAGVGMDLFAVQMVGMLVGGILWGVWGDKRGRITVLFGSILLYSIANIVNAFTFDLTTYGIVRFIAGVGLAGELGAGITLVTETMPKGKRGYGTMIVVVFGALGAVFAAEVAAQGQKLGSLLTTLTGHAFMDWQIAYIVGGLLGLVLLILRVGAFESGMYASMRKSTVRRGDLRMLFNDRKRFIKYLSCILIGVPVWYVVGVLVNLSQDVFVPALGIDTSMLDEAGLKQINGEAIKYAYIGLSVGDLLSALLSQMWRSRKKVIYLYLVVNLLLTVVFLFGMRGVSISVYNWMCFLLGTATGYWVLFVTVASEQFGTNIRSTVATTTPNFVRGSVWPITVAFQFAVPLVGNVGSALVVGLICFGAALWATTHVHETFHSDMDFLEV
ncbi:MAG: MFS transporter [Flavobacteriales bacterium]|nr:MFS transporter [Flavobacteriales bacterium]MCB9167539.1 MFS transporter [Flavobacteriales bacterium]